MPTEPATMQLIRHSLSLNKKVYVPQVIPDSLLINCSTSMRMCRLSTMDELAQWPTNKWGIKEPSLPLDEKTIKDEATEDGGLDLVIVPGLAFTMNGHRLGRGGGYYDRYLNWYRKVATERKLKFPLLVAMAFCEQILEDLPMEPHDNKMDRVITA
ncbi:unnamed protein product [Echinostoma caproni]|uniref:5-formyltetrahydrofolate cyclo-ligase n=1 Tax=Echinostoma caproni TaxID=27848 RepID=A0A183B2V2_9TREM|nr:unnamed protein product [Echinostoma caproni]